MNCLKLGEDGVSARDVDSSTGLDSDVGDLEVVDDESEAGSALAEADVGDWDSAMVSEGLLSCGESTHGPG